MHELDPQVLQERYDLAIERIREIPAASGGQAHGQDARGAAGDFFRRTADFILLMDEARTKLQDPDTHLRTAQEWQALNHAMYEDVLPENYAHSYANPAFATRVFGKEMGQALCFLYEQIRGLTGWVFEGLLEEVVIHMELFLEVYGCFAGGARPRVSTLKDILYWFVSDYCDVLVTERVRQSIDPARDFAVRIICESDLTDPVYLYRYGEYVTDHEIWLSKYLASLPEETIDRMAGTFAEGYRTGFVKAGKDLSKKLTVNIRYQLGFERVVKRAIGLFAGMVLRPVIFRHALSAVNRRGALRLGYTGAVANPQHDYDHREDAALFLDKRFMQRRLAVMRSTFETFLTLANAHAGPAVIEVFGEEPFSPAACEGALTLSGAQQKLQVEMNNEAAQITNRYIIAEERSFTIIAFPVPAIGPHFEEIFADTIRINTLDAALYERIQQCLIDLLDRGEYVHILGCGENRTDLTVALAPLDDPARQTAFENCVADVNIPVGEVFTSPKLEGTNGVLHVSQVYLQGLLFKDLSLTFADGMISEYSCGNFEDSAAGRDYIRANVLFHHDTLPMGEFAIGTNTTAYVMGRRYGIGALLPILIAEKTGPHFAVGDTCYSWEEDVPVFNPDGRECIARENSISALRKTDPSGAYFGCHTDITIPYEELGLIEVITREGERIPLIRDGLFVAEGAQELNEPLLDEAKVMPCVPE